MDTKDTVRLSNFRNNIHLPPIAIIGLSGILPEAENLNQYWENILNEVNCIKEVPSSRWNIDEYYDPDPSAPDKSYSKYGGFIPDIQFDPMEFGLPPNLLEVTDVSQLLSLMVAKNALIDAGYMESGKEILNRTGVILGMVGMSSKVIHPLLNRLQYPIWEKVLRSSSIPEDEIPEIVEKMKLAYISWNENAFPGAIGNVVAGRIANRLDLGGTNCIVDAACGSSLAAVSMSVSELALGRADMMISGGVDTDNSILTYLCFSKTPAYSKGGHLRAFSAESDGMLTGEGLGMLVLKRLEDAERDNDRIYSVIRGIGSSSDGHFKSIYAPRPSGQAKAIRRAYEQADYSPATVRLIEAHGTGTIAGDPAEFDGLTEAFNQYAPAKQIIALGSVKSQIGHTKATAGAASLIKTSLALHQKVLPATINVSKPHPAMEIESTPFYLNTETRPWFKDPRGNPRRAGVSSFGFGGTNFHIAMEEYQKKDGDVKRRRHVPYSILLSAETPGKLLIICRETLDCLNNEDSINIINKLDSDTNSTFVPIENARIGFVAETIDNAREKLKKCIKMLNSSNGQEKWSHPEGIFYRKSGMETTGKTVALFPGQGSQYVNMGKDLAINFAPFREAFEKGNEIFSSDGKEPLTSIVYPIPVFSDDERKAQSQYLTKTENAQPAIGTFSLALYQLLGAAGFQADYYAGHSFGELTALWASGVYSSDAFLRLAKARGEAMGLPTSSDKDTGTMIAVKGDVEKLRDILEVQDAVTIANLNSPAQVVLAGATDAVELMKDKLEELEFSVYPLQVSAAFHTSFVEHAQAPFREAIQKETFKEPLKAVYSNSTAQKHDQDPQKIADNLAEHILHSVNFKKEIENIYKDGGSIFIEIGPRKILTNLVKDILKNQPFESITLNPNPKGDSDFQLRQAVLQMRVLGFKLNNIDLSREYQTPVHENHSKVTVTLNGGFFTTPKTRDAFEQALGEKTNKNPKSQVVNQKVIPAASEMKPHSAKFSSTQIGNSTLNVLNKEESSIMNEESQMNTSYQLLELLLERFHEHQNGVLKAHELFLQNDKTAKNIIQDIASAEITILSKLNGNSQSSNTEQILSLLEKRAEIVNSQQNGSSEAHREFIRSQSEFSQQYAALIGEMVNHNGKYNPIHMEKENVLEKDSRAVKITRVEDDSSSESTNIQNEVSSSQAPQPISRGYDTDQLSQSFLQIVSDKTGYPTDMLELSMDMEADLGIDSIKRVEILGAMQEEYPQLPTIQAEDLVLLRTLKQIIAAFNTGSQDSRRESPEQEELFSQPESVAVMEGPINSTAGLDLQTAFLEIVSEKTGYPADMLEIGMDMEADLGIDSIKRVEILGAMQEQFPKLPTIEAEELSMLRTLEQIIQKFSGNSATTSTDGSKPQAPSESQVSQPQVSEIERHTVKLKMLPKPDFLKFDIPDDSLILITDDETEKSSMLADLYIQKNIKVGMIHFSSAEVGKVEHSNNGISHYYISHPDEEAIQFCMNNILEKNEKISAFIHINPASNGKTKSLLDISQKNADILKSVFLIARHLKKPLSAAGENGRSVFMTVTQMDGQLGLNGSISNDPLPGGFPGLAKSLRLEWKNVFCRALDIHPDIDPKTVVKMIDDEMHDVDLHLTEIGYTSDGRYTLSLN